MKSVHKLLSLAFIGLYCFLNWAHAESIDFPSIASSSVHIVNQGNQAIRFSTRPANGQWNEYSLHSGDSMTISCDNCNTPYFEFSMNTNGRIVNYNLNSAQRFVIFWNSQAGLWDVSQVP